MKCKSAYALCIIGLVVGVAALSGCPQGETEHVAWLVNLTTATYTHFVTGVEGSGLTFVTVPLDAPIGPNSAQRFVFNDAFRGTVTYMGLSGGGGGFAIPNNGAFGFGDTDFVLIETGNSPRWVKGAA